MPYKSFGKFEIKGHTFEWDIYQGYTSGVGLVKINTDNTGWRRFLQEYYPIPLRLIKRKVIEHFDELINQTELSPMTERKQNIQFPHITKKNKPLFPHR